MVGLVIPVAMSVGLVLMNLLTSASTETKWALLGCLAIIGPIISTFFIREGKVERLPDAKQEKLSIREKLSKVYPSPRKYPEFTWAILVKFLIMMGYYSLLYITMMLVNGLGYTETEATGSVATINIFMLIAAAVMSVLGGVLSDKVGKQKPLLYGSAMIMIVGLLLIGFVPHYSAILIAVILIGLGFGCFSAVDTALVARILPNKEDSAKDFGLMNVANALPQSIVPALAPLLLIGGWETFYVALALFVVLGMLTIKPLPEVSRTSNTTN